MGGGLPSPKPPLGGRGGRPAFAEARSRISASLREVCQTPLFRGSVIWQNRQVLHNGIDVLVRMREDAPDGYRRRHEELVYNYVQRYSAKNDSISVFGPVGRARFADPPSR